MMGWSGAVCWPSHPSDNLSIVSRVLFEESKLPSGNCPSDLTVLCTRMPVGEVRWLVLLQEGTV